MRRSFEATDESVCIVTSRIASATGTDAMGWNTFSQPPKMVDEAFIQHGVLGWLDPQIEEMGSDL